MRRLLRRMVDLSASNGTACVLFLLLFLLTLLGTLEQTRYGLYEVQNRYFGSMYLVHYFFGVIPVLLPGVYLLLILLFVNLLVGGIIRARKGLRFIGVITAHAGILLLLLGALIQAEVSTSGHLTLYEGDTSGEFESYYDWEIAVADATGPGPFTEFIIPDDDFLGLNGNRHRLFRHPDLPFALVVDGVLRNCLPRPAAPGASPAFRVIDGFYLEPLPREREAERNVVGAHVTLVDDAGGPLTEALLWGMSQHPFTLSLDGRDWVIDLRKKRHVLPFAIRLDNFTHEFHPGTGIPRVFMSEVTRIEADAEIPVRITMNEPLRHHGYTLYQASWGPANARPGDRLFSTLAVVNNPADQFPLYASIVITLGLAIHFAQRLLAYLRTTKRGTS